LNHKRNLTPAVMKIFNKYKNDTSQTNIATNGHERYILEGETGIFTNTDDFFFLFWEAKNA